MKFANPAPLGLSGFALTTWLLTAALAFYLAAADVINETRGEAVLPIGPYRAA